jgi:hypothetical protein
MSMGYRPPPLMAINSRQQKGPSGPTLDSRSSGPRGHYTSWSIPLVVRQFRPAQFRPQLPDRQDSGTETERQRGAEGGKEGRKAGRKVLLITLVLTIWVKIKKNSACAVKNHYVYNDFLVYKEECVIFKFSNGIFRHFFGQWNIVCKHTSCYAVSHAGKS